MKQLVIIAGGFHPFHAGHLALYQSAKQAFPGADVKVAATNDTSARPFPFALKEKLAQLAGVPPGKFYQVKSPFGAEEITSKYNPETTQLIFVRSEKNSRTGTNPEGPFPAEPDPKTGKLPLATRGKRKGLPVSDRLQYYQPDQPMAPMTQHAYLAYLPTVEFGPGMTSATEIRSAWPTLNPKRKSALVMSLYPATQSNPKLAANVVGMLDTAMGTEDVAEATSIPQPGPSSGAPKQFGSDAKIQTRQMTAKDIISSVPGVPYYNNVVDDWDAKDYSWGVTKKVIEYATYLKDHPETVTQLPPAIVLNGKFEDGAHRVSAIWLLQQRMDPKNPLWKNAKLNVQFVKQDVAEAKKELPQWKKDWYAQQKPNSWPKHPQPYHNPKWMDELSPEKRKKLANQEVDETSDQAAVDALIKKHGWNMGRTAYGDLAFTWQGSTYVFYGERMRITLPDDRSISVVWGQKPDWQGRGTNELSFAQAVQNKLLTFHLPIWQALDRGQLTDSQAIQKFKAETERQAREAIAQGVNEVSDSADYLDESR